MAVNGGHAGTKKGPNWGQYQNGVGLACAAARTGTLRHVRGEGRQSQGGWRQAAGCRWGKKTLWRWRCQHGWRGRGWWWWLDGHFGDVLSGKRLVCSQGIGYFWYVSSAGSIHHVMWSFPAKIWAKNAQNHHITWRPWAFKTCTFGITWCDNFWPNLRLKVAEGFHMRWRILAAHFPTGKSTCAFFCYRTRIRNSIRIDKREKMLSASNLN